MNTRADEDWEESVRLRTEGAQKEDSEMSALSWRMAVLLDAGYDEQHAGKLVALGADLHEAERLIRGGCPQDLALRILS